MKITFLTRNYPPTVCGVGDHTFFLAQELAQKGITVSVLCFSDQTPVQSDNINVYPIIKSWNTEGVSVVIDFIKKLNPHWFITQYVPHGFHPKGLPFAFSKLYLQLNRLNVPILTVFHEVKIRPEKHLKTRILSFLQAQLADSMADKSSKIVTSIDFYKGYLTSFSHKISLVPIPSNIPPIDVKDDIKQHLRIKNNIADNAKIICTFGDRNIENFLAAFDKLVLKHPELIWLICGKNSTPLHVLNSCPYIRYVGKMSAENIYQYLSLGDVFFMPDDINSVGEGGTSNKSGSLACAFSLGIPIVATKGDLNNKLLMHKKNILLTEITNTEALFEDLNKCFAMPNLALELGNNARELYNNQLQWMVVADKILAIISNLNQEAAISHVTK
jgi:glycosyltransferase involved in cell wall biosynthesis